MSTRLLDLRKAREACSVTLGRDKEQKILLLLFATKDGTFEPLTMSWQCATEMLKISRENSHAQQTDPRDIDAAMLRAELLAKDWDAACLVETIVFGVLAKSRQTMGFGFRNKSPIVIAISWSLAKILFEQLHDALTELGFPPQEARVSPHH